MLRDGRALERAVPRVEVASVLRAALEVEGVDVADGVDRRARLVLEDLVRRGALIDHVLGVERVLEADAIEVLAVPQDGLSLAVRLDELLVLAEDVLAARMQREVHGVAAEVLVEVCVVVLALLPARRDGGDLALDAELLDRVAEGRVVALGAEQYDGGDLARDHEARTFSVRPT